MKIQRILQRASSKLKLAGYEDSLWQAKVLAAHLFGCSPGNVILNTPDEKIDDIFTIEFNRLLQKLVSGIPLQHVIGEWDFFGRTFKVDSRALIPRPETELLIELVLKHNIPSDSLILDVGSGSGIIGLTLAKELPGSLVIGIDISPEALTLAQENKKLLQAENLLLLQSDLLQSVKSKFHLIVANLPYIPTADLALLDSIVINNDPHLALDGGETGITLISRLINSARNHIYSGGLVILETGYDQAEVVSNLFLNNFWHKPICYNDLTGKHRMVAAIRR